MWAGGNTGVIRWDGVSWQTTGLFTNAYCIVERSPTDVLVCGNNAVHHWDGIGWTSHTLPANPSTMTVSNGTTYLGGSDGVLYQP